MSQDFASLDGRAKPDALVAMGGAVTNLAAVKHEMSVYDPDIIRGTVLDRETIDRDMERDRFFSPKQAQEYGLIDHVLGDELPDLKQPNKGFEVQ